ncbi:MAG TPA: HAMP domain-containing sensor histidine kinase [Blastocatellia bacterium]|nr:HAMP domain-containing sensor histidine kinase [Blastocatellia bacterium]
MIKDSEEAILIETGRMAARLIHDFKNQIGGLKLYAAYLQKRFADNAEGMEIVEKIAKGLNEMAEQASILNQLARPLELRLETGDPALIIEQAVSRLQSRASAKRAKITLSLDPDAPRISFDSRQIGAALESVISRAVDATPEDGAVEISLRRKDEALEVEIKDNGPTLDDNQRQNFFDPLAGDRLNKVALGLAMARRIIEKHGGRISARADTPSGTIVEVRLDTD